MKFFRKNNFFISQKLILYLTQINYQTFFYSVMCPDVDTFILPEFLFIFNVWHVTSMWADTQRLEKLRFFADIRSASQQVHLFRFTVYWLTIFIACYDVTQEHGWVLPVMSFDVRDDSSERVVCAIEFLPSFIFLETATGRLTRMLASNTTAGIRRRRGRDENRARGRCDSSRFTTIDIISRKLMMNVIILSGDSRETRWRGEKRVSAFSWTVRQVNDWIPPGRKKKIISRFANKFSLLVRRKLSPGQRM